MAGPLNFRILHWDMSDGAHELKIVAPELLREHLGGANLAAQIAYPSLVPETDPLSPEAPLIFMAGPLTGTKGPAVGRYVVCARSPATGLWGESNCGGSFGPELRAAGLDGLVITGQAPSPVYLWIDDGEVEIRDASHLWGSHDTYETQLAVRNELGRKGARVACIGQAGEQRLRFGLILCDHGRVAGRTGMGAVMGSKRIKAIAVEGRQPLPLASPDAFNATRSETNRSLRVDTMTVSLRDLGTAGIAEYFDYLGYTPKYNFSRGIFDGVSKVSGAAMRESILSGVSTCHGCVIACGRRVKLADGVERKGPEYETLAGFGPNLGIDNLEAITHFGELCDRYGMDTISVSNTIGLAFLLFEEGLITAEDADGLDLAWGDVDVVNELIEAIILQKGIGALIGEGAASLGRHFGVEEWAAQINGLEMAYHDPRGSSGMPLVYATSPRGACHNQSDYYMVDLGQSMEEIGVDLVGMQAGVEKSPMVARHQDWRTVGNALVMCQLASVGVDVVLKLVNEATGFGYDLDELLCVGERGWNLKRAINNRLGLTASNDRLPARLMEPLSDGNTAGYVPPFEKMMAAYYSARGWDEITGRPTEERLRSLGLDAVADDLWGNEGHITGS